MLLDYYNPKILQGLTATPERMDGKDILERFDGKIACELRLPEAIDRKLLSPFQYFAVSDSVDLSSLKWTRGGYDSIELEKIYTNNDIRINEIVKSLYKYCTNIEEVKGLGFCASINHAKFMANSFNNRGIPSIALLGESRVEDRNTVLFLRPTESLTIFIQQLGRGLIRELPRASSNQKLSTLFPVFVITLEGTKLYYK